MKTKKILYIPLILLMTFITCSCSANKKSEISIIDDVVQYSKISESQLKNIVGDPSFSEEWTNKTSKGDFNVKTLSYNKNDMHYEFIIADDCVTRLTIYSDQYWNNTGDLFKYDCEKKEIPKMFGVELGDNVKKVADNNITYKLGDVNNKIDIFDIQELDPSSNTFGFIKITYDSNYFD